MNSAKDRDRRVLVKAIVLLAGISLALVVFFKFVAHYVHRSSLLKVTFQTASGESKPFYLTIASTPNERELGLMYQTGMPKDEGMLFIFPDEAPRGFWMKNTYIPLDIIFLDKDLKVQGAVENVPVLSESVRSLPGVRSKYVIELNAGLVREVGVAEGAKAILHGPIPVGIPNREKEAR